MAVDKSEDGAGESGEEFRNPISRDAGVVFRMIREPWRSGVTVLVGSSSSDGGGDVNGEEKTDE
jgi:hypothetical protein